jgi:hypothetical protein
MLANKDVYLFVCMETSQQTLSARRRDAGCALSVGIKPFIEIGPANSLKPQEFTIVILNNHFILDIAVLCKDIAFKIIKCGDGYTGNLDRFDWGYPFGSYFSDII